MELRFERSGGMMESIWRDWPDAPEDLPEVVTIEMPGDEVQLTYNLLRVAPEGANIATFLDTVQGAGWFLADPQFDADLRSALPQITGIYNRNGKYPFSDIVIG